MNRLFLLTLCALALVSCQEKTIITGSWDMAPALRTLSETEESFVLDSGTTIEADDSLQEAAGALSDLLGPYVGRPVPLKAGRHSLVLRLDENLGEGLLPFQKEECYALEVTAGKVVLTAATALGAFHGVQTLAKALPATCQEGECAALPGGQVLDYPEYPYRAFMLDCGRHFFPVSTVKKIIDILALHQLNAFHWHLSEDQGWRLEIKKYPRLTEVGSWRAGSPVPGREGHDGVPVSGFYTQEEAREVVAYAAARGIEVIPEIDLPGHMKAALASYPELGCTGGPYEVACEYGVLDDVLCAGRDQTLQFVCDVLDEVMDIFPSRYIHLGGDECPKVRWEACPRCQAKISSLGLKGRGKRTGEELLQSWFMDQVSAYVEAHGRRSIAWNDVLVDWSNDVIGAPSKKTVMAGWMRPVSTEIAVREGYDAIFCPVGHLYLSAKDGNELQGEAYLRRVFDAPVPAWQADEKSHILGIEACIWTERVDNEDLLLWELLPRLSLVSDLQWADPTARDFKTMLPRLSRMQEHYTARGWKWNEAASSPNE